MRTEITDRYYRVYTGQDVDRVPDIEFGYWPQTIRRWQSGLSDEQGEPVPQTTLAIGQLVFHVGAYEREQCGEGRELVTIDVAAESRASDLGDALMLPAAELRDAGGAIYSMTDEEKRWERPIDPRSTVATRLAFEVPSAATGLELVLAPGSEDEGK